MRTRPVLGLLVLLTLTIAAPQLAIAGTINVSGSLTFTGGSSGSVSLVGDRGFTLNAGTSALDAFVGPFEACGFIPCPSGRPISVNAVDVGGSFLAVRGTLDGVTFPSASCTPPDCLSLAMIFNGNPVIAPPSNVASVVALTNPVTLEFGVFVNQFSPENLVASAEATVVLEKANFSLPPNCPLIGDCWRFASVTYDLSPVPEPTTLLLWGTTMAGLGLARWRRHRPS
jgi:hypothetical protein